MKYTKNLQKNVGTFLMIAGVSLLFYIYYPIALAYFFPQPQPQQPTVNAQTNESYWIEIPKINAANPIVMDVDPWDADAYKESLKEGIAHAKGTARPGEKGTYLFAHSSDYPWNITRYNTAFFKLHELERDDSIIIRNGDITFEYKVVDMKEVWPTEVQYLKNPNADLILQTCTPIGTDLRRLLVFATLKTE